MNRRNFLKNTSGAGITIATASLGIYNEAMAAPLNEVFVDFDLNEITIAALQQKIRTTKRL